MAPDQPQRVDKEKRLKSMIALAQDLEATLASHKDPVSTRASLSKHDFELKKQITDFPRKALPGTGSRQQTIDEVGTRLWNTATRFKRNLSDTAQPDNTRLVTVGARVFAYFLLDYTWNYGKRSMDNLERIFKTGLKAAKDSIDVEDYICTELVLEKVGGYEALIQKECTEAFPEILTSCKPLMAEFYVLATALAWKKKSVKVAEHMYNKAMQLEFAKDSQATEDLAEVLYEIGKQLLTQDKEVSSAIFWLDRAFSAIDSAEPEHLSLDAGELRISIWQARIKARIASPEPGQLLEAKEMLQLLENEIGDKLVVLLLRLEMFLAAKDEMPDLAVQYHAVLKRMMAIVTLGDENFKLIMFHIRRLYELNAQLACRALDTFFLGRFKIDGKQAQIEKIVVTRVYMTGDGGSQEVLEAFEEFLLSIASNVMESLSAAVSLGVHTLLWKKIEALYNQGSYHLAERWCAAAMHEVFANSGEINMSRISRKRLLCLILKDDYDNAREVFSSLPDSAKKEPLTQFLMFKVGVRSEDHVIASESLQLIATGGSGSQDLLYACCLEAQEFRNKALALTALQAVIQVNGYHETTMVDLPCLIRCTIRLLIEGIESSKSSVAAAEIASSVVKLCDLFEGAANSASRALSKGKSEVTKWSISELDWFSKNSYNIVIRHLCDWHPSCSLRILLCCIKFIDHYPVDVSQQTADDLILRKVFCEFSSATALLALARGEDNTEIRTQNYLDLRKHVSSYDKLLEEKLNALEEPAVKDLMQKLAILLTYDFEAACQLRDFDNLGEVILRAAVCKSMRVFQLMADCLLCSDVPTAAIVVNMKKIINVAWSLQEIDIVSLSKYMRCIFQIALADDEQVAADLLLQVITHAEHAAQSEQEYPREEMEWIITNAFNHGIDLFCSDQDEKANQWTHGAINLAAYFDDGGQLQAQLQEKVLALNFGSEAHS